MKVDKIYTRVEKVAHRALKWTMVALFVAFGYISNAQKVGDIDVQQWATDTLGTYQRFQVANDTVWDVLDVAFFRFSSDGVTYHKNYNTGDSYAIYSGYSELSWDTLNFAIIFEGLHSDTTFYYLFGNTGSETADDSKDSLYFIGQGGTTVTISNDTLYFTSDTWSTETLGTVTTAENVGNGGVGFFDAKVDSILNFRNLYSDDALLTVTLDADDSLVVLDIDWKTLTAGVGMIGGGNFNNDITINYNIPTGFPTSPSGAIDGTEDWISFYDNDSAIHYKIHPKTFFDELHTDTTYWTIIGDTGSDTPDQSKDSVFFIGEESVTTRVSGDTVYISATASGLPACGEGQILQYIGGEWVCADICDVIAVCGDTIISVIYDTITVIIAEEIGDLTGDVYTSLTRGAVSGDFSGCDDSLSITVSSFNLSNAIDSIRIATVPTSGYLFWGVDTLAAGDVVSVTSDVFDSTFYYEANADVTTDYNTSFTFSPLYSTLSDYSDTATFNIAVSTCIGYDDDIASTDYGYLYNYYAVQEGLASTGWHVMTAQDAWDLMIAHDPDGDNTTNDAGEDIRLPAGTFWNIGTGSGLNTLGFSARATGSRNGNTGAFDLQGTWFETWMSDTRTGSFGFRSYIKTSDTKFYLSDPLDLGTSPILAEKTRGMSVIVVADATTLASDGDTGSYVGNDGKIYPTIRIAGKEYITRPLEETLYNNLTSIPNVSNAATWIGLSTGAYCIYE